MNTSALEKLVLVRQLASSGEARRRRQDADLSLSEIAEAVGVTTGTVWKWETGLRRPNGAAAIKYLSLLDRLGSLPKVAA